MVVFLFKLTCSFLRFLFMIILFLLKRIHGSNGNPIFDLLQKLNEVDLNTVCKSQIKIIYLRKILKKLI